MNINPDVKVILTDVWTKIMFGKGFEVQKDKELTQDINESVIYSLIHSCGNFEH